jgi:hypothetical protein
MAGLPPGIRPWSGNNGRGPPGAPPGGVAPRTLPGLEGPRTGRKKGRAKSANPPMKHSGPRQVEQDLPAKMALARTVSDLDRKLQRTSLEMQEKENSLFAKSGQVDTLSQTVEFQQIKLNSLDLSLKLKEKEVKTLSDQLRKQERLIRRLQRKNTRLAGSEDGAGEDTGTESDGTEGSDGSAVGGEEQEQEENRREIAPQPSTSQAHPPAAQDHEAAAQAAADAAFDKSTALAEAPVSSRSLGEASVATSVSSGGGQPYAHTHHAVGGRNVASAVLNDDDDGTEWFPIAAMCAAAADRSGGGGGGASGGEHSSTQQQPIIPLDARTCSLGQAVRIMDVASLRAAIENHSVEGETTFEWAPEDAQWAGRRGVRDLLLFHFLVDSLCVV